MRPICEGHLDLEQAEVVPNQSVGGKVQTEGQHTRKVGAVEHLPGASN